MHHIIDVDAQDVGDLDVIGITVAGSIRLVARLDVRCEGLLGAFNLARSASRAARLRSISDDLDGVLKDGAGLGVDDGVPEVETGSL